MNGLGTLTGAPQAGMPQVQNPTPGMGGIAQPPAPGGATNRPVVEMRAQILRNIFGNIGAPMPDDVAHQIASQPSPFERQLEGMRQKAVVQGQIDMAKKLMELEVAIEQERRTKQVGREDIIARTTRPRREGLVPGILRGTGLSQYLPESLTTKPSIEELETQQGESRALRELRQAQAEKARRPETTENIMQDAYDREAGKLKAQAEAEGFTKVEQAELKMYETPLIQLRLMQGMGGGAGINPKFDAGVQQAEIAYQAAKANIRAARKGGGVGGDSGGGPKAAAELSTEELLRIAGGGQ